MLCIAMEDPMYATTGLFQPTREPEEGGGCIVVGFEPRPPTPVSHAECEEELAGVDDDEEVVEDRRPNLDEMESTTVDDDHRVPGNDPFAAGPRPALVKSQSAPATPLVDDQNVQTGLIRSASCRRVSFPANDLLVTGYVEPPNPWEKVAMDMTAMEVVAAYVAACERYNVAPIDCVIKQMQKIGSFSKRLERMDLQGEVLDFGQIEALEEIFKRVQFVSINLADTSLDDEGSTALFDMIEYYESAESLNISRNNNISMRGWQSCCRMIKRMHCLWELNASGIKLGDNVHILQRMLRSGTTLTTLHLENCSISGKHFAILMTALKMNTSLKKLYLSDNKLSCTDAVQVANFLRANCRLKLLNLGNNQLEDKGIVHIAEGLSDQAATTYRSGLATLVLQNNRLTPKSTPHLAKVLKECHHLEALDVGNNDINNEGVHCLKEALIRNRTLQKLGLQGCQITCEGAVALAEYIADNPSIQSMDLRDNTIKLGGLMALTQSMEVNHSVTNLHLDGPPDETLLNNLDHLHQRLLTEITTYCERNTEITEQRRAEEEEQRGEDQDEILSEPVSRLLSLWSNAPLPRRSAAPPTSLLTTPPPPPITVSPVVESPTGENGCGGWQTIRGASSPHHLRSPQPSPSCSPIPSPTRNRFRVTRVFQEADATASGSASADDDSSSPSPPPPLLVTPVNNSGTGRFGRFKFTPVKIINGVDASIPPSASTSGAPKKETVAPDRRVRERRTGAVACETPPMRIQSPGSPGEDNDSVFLDTPSGPLNSRVRHNSMLYYQKKMAKEIERRSSLPGGDVSPSLEGAVVEPFAPSDLDRVSVSSSEDARQIDSVADLRGGRTVLRRNGFKSFHVQRVSLPQETEDVGAVPVKNGVAMSPVSEDSGVVAAPLGDFCDTNSDSTAREDDDSHATNPLDCGGDRDSGIYLLDSSMDDADALPCNQNLSEASTSLDDLRCGGEGEEEECGDAPTRSAENHLNASEEVATVTRLTEEDNVSATELVNQFLASSERVETVNGPLLDDELHDRATSEMSGGPDVDRPAVSNNECESGACATEETTSGDEEEDDDDDLELSVVGRVCFSLVNIDDHRRSEDDESSDYADPWPIDAVSRGRSPASLLDLLTGDEDDDGNDGDGESGSASDLGEHRNESPSPSPLCNNGDLMSFLEKDSPNEEEVEVTENQCLLGAGEKMPRSSPDVHAVGGATKRVCFVNELSEEPLSNDGREDLVSVWMLERQDGGATSDWSSSTMSCSTSASSTTSKSLEALLHRGGDDSSSSGGSGGSSESSNSSDSGVPESPVSCSPPPVEDAGAAVVGAERGRCGEGGDDDDGFPDHKTFQRAGGRLSVSTAKQISLGLDILERLDLKSSVPLSPGQLAQSKGIMDMATEFLIQREESPSSMEMRRESSKLNCPGVDKLLVMPFGTTEETSNT